MPSSDDDTTLPARQPLRWLALVAVLLLGVWVAFFDSHAITKRLHFRSERAALTAENDSLRQSIEALQQKLQHPPADSTIERIAREQYGMHRPGETVYRVER